MISTIEEYSKMLTNRKEKAENLDHLVHSFMIYQCERCNAVYIMWLEKGLEDINDDKITGNHKPVPFCINCPECCGIAKHVLWSIGMNAVSGSYRLLKPEENFFFNNPDDQCGIPIIFKKDFVSLSTNVLEFIVSSILLPISKPDTPAHPFHESSFQISENCEIERSVIGCEKKGVGRK